MKNNAILSLAQMFSFIKGEANVKSFLFLPKRLHKVNETFFLFKKKVPLESLFYTTLTNQHAGKHYLTGPAVLGLTF